MIQANVDRRNASSQEATKKPVTFGDRFIPGEEVREITSLGRTTIYQMQKNQTFPQSIPLPGGRVAWLESEIRQWMNSRVALRKTAGK